MEETKGKKAATIEVFQDATFNVHKWHSNASELEAENDSDAEELPHAKQQLGGTKPSRCKLLGLPWDREQDIFRIVLGTLRKDDENANADVDQKKTRTTYA